MAHPVPLQSFLGGLCIPVPVHALALLNGNVFGISGFLHRAVKGSVEGAAGVAGLVLGGMVVASIDGGKAPTSLALPLSQIAVSGVLVGLGTKLSNGCTSGHMVCGLSRLSLRSLVATISFFTTGVITASFLHNDLTAIGSVDWTLGTDGARYFAFQALPFTASLLLYALAHQSTASPSNTDPNESTNLLSPDDAVRTPSDKPRSQSAFTPNAVSPISTPTKPYASTSLLRSLAFVTTSVHFALALQLSNLTDPLRVVSFLLLPWHRAFDPSLAALAAGALPLSIVLYRYARGREVPVCGGKWSIPKGKSVDWRLVGGAALFGVGWGITGVCPGPALVNLGRALVAGDNVAPFAIYLAALIAGGLLV